MAQAPSRARPGARPATPTPRERAWLAATRGLAGRRQPTTSLAIHEKHGRRMAARPAGRQARPAPCLQPRRRRGAAAHRRARCSRPTATTTTSGPCMPSAWRSAIGSTRPRRTARKAIEMERTRSVGASRHGALPRGARPADRRAWPSCNRCRDTWEDCNSFMYTHNWWHLALFLIDLDRTDEALALFDKRVWGVWKEFSEDQINAISLLARLELRGVDVGARWADVASYLKPRLHEHFSPFLDLQYLYGLARAGEQSAVTEMLASLEDRAEQRQALRARGLGRLRRAGRAWPRRPRQGRLRRRRAPARPGHAAPAADRRQHRPARAVRRHPSRRADASRAGTMPPLKILQADERERPTVPVDQARAGRSLSQARPRRAGDGRRLPGRAARPAIRPGRKSGNRMTHDLTQMTAAASRRSTPRARPRRSRR